MNQTTNTAWPVREDTGGESTSTLRFLVLQDHKENRRKCTVEPLRAVQGVELRRLRQPRPRERPTDVPPGVLLEVDSEAPELRADDLREPATEARCLVLDATWARVPSLRRRLVLDPQRHVRRSLPPGLVTAYPRRSKLYEDPGSGLATVEAIFAVSVIFGEPRADFLRSYVWRGVFLERNSEVLARLGPRDSVLREPTT